MDLVSILITPQVLAIAAATVACLYFAGQMPLRRGKLSGARWWRRILPVLPIALGIGAAFLPGVLVGEDGSTITWGSRILIGAWAGLVAAQGRKVIKRLAVDKLEAKD
jgi:branched-subunit amino acid transport protein